MSKSLPGVLIITPNSSICNLFIQALYKKSSSIPQSNQGKFSQANEVKEGEIEHEIEGEKGEEKCQIKKMLYTLDTKYYTAEICLLLLNYEKLSEIIQSNHQGYLNEHHVKSIEGIIFLLDFSDNKRHGLTEYLKYNKDIISMHAPSILMSYVHRNSDDQSDLYNALDFENSENFIEIIDSNLNIELDTQILEVKDKLEDKMGISRVIEVFECNIWPNMVKKNAYHAGGLSKKPIPKEDYEEDKEDYEENKEGYEDDYEEKRYQLMEDDEEVRESKGKVIEEKSNKMPEVKGNNGLDTNVNKALEMKSKEIKEENHEKVDKRGDSSEAGKPKSKAKEPENFNFEEFEHEMDDFAKIFESMKNLKEKGQSMPDDKRKAQAEELILKLMESFKGLGDDDDDDGFEDEDVI